MLATTCTPPPNRDYTPFLKADALKGARIGIARDFLGQDAEVDWVIEAALALANGGTCDGPPGERSETGIEAPRPTGLLSRRLS